MLWPKKNYGEAPFLDLHQSISNDFVSSKIYDNNNNNNNNLYI